MFITILAFLFTLTILVFVHELGHFLVARLNGVKVEVFSIGFGKSLFGYTDKKGTRWQFSLIPFGGYVKMFGDANEASVETQDQDNLNHLTDEEKKLTYTHKKPLQKIAIAFAGPLFNYLLAILILTLYLMFHGTFVPSNTAPDNTISGIMEHSPADTIPLKPLDKITKINNITIHSYKDLAQALKGQGGKTIDISYLRKGKSFTAQIKLDDVNGNGRLGIYISNLVIKKFSFLESLKHSSLFSYRMSSEILRYIKNMFRKHPDMSQLGGPIKIAQMSGTAARQGMASLWYFIAMLSINLGIMNLLPLPILDGGNILLSFIELISGRKLHKNILTPITYIAIALLFSLMIFTTIKDLPSLFK